MTFRTVSNPSFLRHFILSKNVKPIFPMAVYVRPSLLKRKQAKRRARTLKLQQRGGR